MKISLEWLSEYLPGPLSADVAADTLTHGGLPVELIERRGDDTVIDVEVTSNRGDCLSHLGVARELGALLNRHVTPPQPQVKESAGTPALSATSVRIEASPLCPLYTARVIRNVRIGSSPAWMARRLEAVGLRPINNVVDVTNYVMFELGQPLHAFDMDRLDGRRIVVREARRGENIVSIDGKERELSAGMLVIADAQRAVAVAGVMGGKDTEVSAGTTSVLLESARFDALSVRKTSRALALKSDSSYRFERQIDPVLAERASLRAAQLILETAGGELLSGSVVAGDAGFKPKRLTLRLARLSQVLGVELATNHVVDALKRLQLNPALHGDWIEVTVPSWRLDLNIEVDLVEEVARIIGYGNIPVRDEISIRLAPPNPEAVTMDEVRSALVAAGFFESLTFSFVTDQLRDDFVPPEAKQLLRADPTVRKVDAHLRPSILPGLLEAVRRNETAGVAGARLFETGSTFWTEEMGRVVERRRLGLVGTPDYREVRGAVEVLLEQLNRDLKLNIVPDQRPGFAAGACGRIEWGGKHIGHIGRIDRAIADKLGLREPPAAAELELSVLLALAQHVPQLRPLPRFPSVRRDLSLVVPEATTYEQVHRLVRELRPEHLEDLEYVTTYRGKPLEMGRKSVTVTLVFRSEAGTLTGDVVERAVDRIVKSAADQLGATLRV